MKARLDRMRDHRKRVTSEESNALEDCTGEPRTGEPRLGHLLDTANQKAAPMQVPPWSAIEPPTSPRNGSGKVTARLRFSGAANPNAIRPD
jgi:hypothetical protein